MPLRTAFTDLVGCEHPILCGGMQVWRILLNRR